MTEQLIEIGRRLRALREICDMTRAELAEKLGVTVDDIKAYEEGERDFSFSFLYNAAGVLGVDVVDIMSGDSPKLSTVCLVRAGDGFEVQRRAAYSYKHLAFTFRKKLAEPFMVTAEPRANDGKPELHAHSGQEFNLMVEGSMQFYIGDNEYTLNTGDSVYFDSSVPHAMKANNNKAARFLAVVLNGR